MGVWSLGAYGLHHDQTDPGLLQDYARVLPGYTMADIIGSFHLTIKLFVLSFNLKDLLTQ